MVASTTCTIPPSTSARNAINEKNYMCCMYHWLTHVMASRVVGEALVSVSTVLVLGAPRSLGLRLVLHVVHHTQPTRVGYQHLGGEGGQTLDRLDRRSRSMDACIYV